MLDKVLFRRDVLEKDGTSDSNSAAAAVEKLALTRREATNFTPNLPNSTHAYNRKKSKISPPEPNTITCAINIELVNIPLNFICKDIKLNDGRHIILASDHQLDLLMKTGTWYMDGTCQVIREPFYQLYGLHGFLRCGKSIKLVPLLWILMSRRQRIDYERIFSEIESHCR